MAAQGLSALANLLLGGIPNHSDVAPSAVFTVAYGLLTPLLLFRVARKETRTLILFFPFLVIQVRIATWIVRILQGQGNLGETLFIVEQVFLSMGTIYLVEPLIPLTSRLIRARTLLGTTTNSGQSVQNSKGPFTWIVARLGNVIQVILFTAVALAAYGGSQTPNISEINLTTTLRKVVAIVLISVVGIIFITLVIIRIQIRGSHTEPEAIMRRGTHVLLGLCLLLMVTVSYRLAAISQDPGISNKAGFYLGFALPEYLTVVLYVAVNLNHLAPVADNEEPKESVAMSSRDRV